MPPFPFSPVGFSGLIERDFASERRDRLPRWSPSPEKRCVIAIVPCDPQRIHLMPLVLIDSMMRFWKTTNIASVGTATTVEAAMM
jgi:hypothetical protein